MGKAGRTGRFLPAVIPAKAGNPSDPGRRPDTHPGPSWTPAFAGVTGAISPVTHGRVPAFMGPGRQWARHAAGRRRRRPCGWHVRCSGPSPRLPVSPSPRLPVSPSSRLPVFPSSRLPAYPSNLPIHSANARRKFCRNSFVSGLTRLPCSSSSDLTPPR